MRTRGGGGVYSLVTWDDGCFATVEFQNWVRLKY